MSKENYKLQRRKKRRAPSLNDRFLRKIPVALLPVLINEGDIERRVFLKGTPQKGSSSCCWGRGNRPHSLKLPASIKELSPHAAYYFAHCWPLSMPLINDCTQCTVFYFFVMWDTPWQAKHSIWKLAMLEYPRYGATQSTNLQTCHTKFCYSATAGREGSPILFRQCPLSNKE